MEGLLNFMGPGRKAAHRGNLGSGLICYARAGKRGLARQTATALCKRGGKKRAKKSGRKGRRGGR